MEKVIVYSNKNCVQCEQTKRMLSTRGIDFEERMIQDSPEVQELIDKHGYTSAPIVVTPQESWSGFKHEKLSAL